MKEEDRFYSKGALHPVPDDLDFAPLESLFREHALKALLDNEATPEERVKLVRSWVHSGFNVDSSRRIAAEDRQELQSLLEYMERSPATLERLEYRSDGLVHYRGNFHPGLGRDDQLLPAVDFLALLVPHGLLRWEVSLRSHGALSTVIRRRLGWIKKDASSPPEVTAVEGDGESLKLRRRTLPRQTPGRPGSTRRPLTRTTFKIQASTSQRASGRRSQTCSSCQAGPLPGLCYVRIPDNRPGPAP